MKLLALVAAVLSLGLCGAAQAADDPLAGHTFRVVEISGEAPPPAAEQTMEFRAGGDVGGRGGCNTYRGSYTLEGDSLTFGPLAATRMACPEPQMDAENRFLAALGDVAAYDYDAASGALALLDADGRPLVRLSRADG